MKKVTFLVRVVAFLVCEQYHVGWQDWASLSVTLVDSGWQAHHLVTSWVHVGEPVLGAISGRCGRRCRPFRRCSPAVCWDHLDSLVTSSVAGSKCGQERS